MNSCITFTVPGNPKGKERPRFNPKTGRFYTPHNTAKYEKEVRERFTEVVPSGILDDIKGFSGKIRMDIVVYHRVPKSWPKEQRERCLANRVACVATPDFGNVAKLIEDALNNVAYADDSCVVPGPHCDKLYSDDPRVEVTVWYTNELCSREEGGGHNDNHRWDPKWVA